MGLSEQQRTALREIDAEYFDKPEQIYCELTDKALAAFTPAQQTGEVRGREVIGNSRGTGQRGHRTCEGATARSRPRGRVLFWLPRHPSLAQGYRCQPSVRATIIWSMRTAGGVLTTQNALLRLQELRITQES